MNTITSYDAIQYFRQFTLDNLLTRKRSMSLSEWKTWVNSLNEYEINCIAKTLRLDEVVQERYNHYKLSRVMLEKYQSLLN